MDTVPVLPEPVPIPTTEILLAAVDVARKPKIVLYAIECVPDADKFTIPSIKALVLVPVLIPALLKLLIVLPFPGAPIVTTPAPISIPRKTRLPVAVPVKLVMLFPFITKVAGFKL